MSSHLLPLLCKAKWLSWAYGMQRAVKGLTLSYSSPEYEMLHLTFWVPWDSQVARDEVQGQGQGGREKLGVYWQGDMRDGNWEGLWRRLLNWYLQYHKHVKRLDYSFLIAINMNMWSGVKSYCFTSFLGCLVTPEIVYYIEMGYWILSTLENLKCFASCLWKKSWSKVLENYKMKTSR